MQNNIRTPKPPQTVTKKLFNNCTKMFSPKTKTYCIDFESEGTSFENIDLPFQEIVKAVKPPAALTLDHELLDTYEHLIYCDYNDSGALPFEKLLEYVTRDCTSQTAASVEVAFPHSRGDHTLSDSLAVPDDDFLDCQDLDDPFKTLKISNSSTTLHPSEKKNRFLNLDNSEFHEPSAHFHHTDNCCPLTSVHHSESWANLTCLPLSDICPPRASFCPSKISHMHTKSVSSDISQSFIPRCPSNSLSFTSSVPSVCQPSTCCVLSPSLQDTVPKIRRHLQ